MNHVQNNSKNAKRSDSYAKSIYDSPDLLNFYIKKTMLEYLSDEIIKKAKLGKTEIVIDRSEHVRLKHGDVFLKWFHVIDDLCASNPYSKEVISELVAHGFKIDIFVHWHENKELTTALLNNDLTREMLRQCGDKLIQLKISWGGLPDLDISKNNQNVSNLCVKASKALKLSDKFHKEKHDKVLSILYRYVDKGKSVIWTKNTLRNNDSFYAYEFFLILKDTIFPDDLYSKKLRKLLYQHDFRLIQLSHTSVKITHS